MISTYSNMYFGKTGADQTAEHRRFPSCTCILKPSNCRYILVVHFGRRAFPRAGRWAAPREFCDSQSAPAHPAQEHGSASVGVSAGSASEPGRGAQFL
eukprot:3180384-Pleurochrysis_carterae.AAC.1